MRRFLFSAVASSAIAAIMPGAPTRAADVPLKAAPPAAVFSWSGLYAGVHAGYGWGETVHANNFGVSTGGFGIDGGLAGGQVGYNWQAGSWVYGLEADIAWTGIDGSTVGACAPATCVTEIDWLATVRARAGVAWDNYLLYATAGVAVADVTGTINGGAGAIFSGDRTRTGWTAGAGIEAAFASRWTGRLEYLYVDLGDDNFYTFVVPGPATVIGNVDTSVHLLRAALNYRF